MNSKDMQFKTLIGKTHSVFIRNLKMHVSLQKFF